MNKLKVVITDYEYASLEEEKAVLLKAGIELITAQCKTEEEVIEVAHDADGIINQYAPITKKVIDRLDHCKVIGRYGIGVDTVDVAAATEKGIFVSNVPNYCWDEVSDHAMALIMACTRKVVTLNNSVKSGTWDYKVGAPIYRLRDRVLGLVGFGNIPQIVTKKAQVFGLKVIAYDPFVPKDVADNLNVELVSLDELCQTADIISVHAPLNKQTRGLVSYEQFKLMKNEAFIINTARGPIIDENALIDALKNNQIAGAGLDVLENEPIHQDSPLLSMDQVIINPHVAWYSEESQAELQRKTAENVASVLTGHYPKYFVNKEVKEKVVLKDYN